MPQPFIKVRKLSGEYIIINESQVVAVSPAVGDWEIRCPAVLHLTNGEQITVSEPWYDQWEADALIRKQ